MMRYIQYAWLALFLPSISFGAIDLDVDKNGATDVNRGGSNATTAASARSNLGLGNVTNTSDANKPVSTAQQSALDLKSNITCFVDASAFNTCFGLDWITAAGISLGTTDNVTFGNITASGGTLTVGVGGTTQGTLVLKTNTDPVWTFGLAPAASPSAIVSLKAPGAMPTADNSLLNFDINGTGGWTDPATFLTPSGVGGALTVTATGFDGNLATTDNTLQEIAQKVDDLVLGSGGGYSNLTEFVAQTAWRLFYSDGSGDVKELSLGSDGEYLKSNGAALAPSWSTPSGAAHDAVTLGTDAAAILGLSTQEITLDSQTANYVLAAPNGSAGDPTFRALVAADIPTLNQNTTGTAGGLTGTPNITVGTISAGTSGFGVGADGDVTAKSVTVTRTTSPSAIDLYEGTGEPGDNKLTITLSGGLAADATLYADQILVDGDIGSTVQAYDADLTTWAGVTPSANGRSLVAAADYAAMRGLLDLESGTDFNAYDADLTTWAGITPGSNVGTFLATPSGANLATALTSALPATKGGTGLTSLGTNVATAMGNTLGSAGGVTTTIASGTSALGTGAINTATCATVVTTTATNTATTDVINWGFNSDPTGVTGYAPLATGMLTIIAYPSSGNVNFKVCNNTAASITPGAITLNWRVQR